MGGNAVRASTPRAHACARLTESKPQESGRHGARPRRTPGWNLPSRVSPSCWDRSLMSQAWESSSSVSPTSQRVRSRPASSHLYRISIVSPRRRTMGARIWAQARRRATRLRFGLASSQVSVAASRATSQGERETSARRARDERSPRPWPPA